MSVPPSSLDQKWDRAIDIFIKRLVYGTISGGATGLVLFSTYSFAVGELYRVFCSSQRHISIGFSDADILLQETRPLVLPPWPLALVLD